MSLEAGRSLLNGREGKVIWRKWGRTGETAARLSACLRGRLGCNRQTPENETKGAIIKLSGEKKR